MLQNLVIPELKRRRNSPALPSSKTVRRATSREVKDFLGHNWRESGDFSLVSVQLAWILTKSYTVGLFLFRMSLKQRSMRERLILSTTRKPSILQKVSREKKDKDWSDSWRYVINSYMLHIVIIILFHFEYLLIDE